MTRPISGRIALAQRLDDALSTSPALDKQAAQTMLDEARLLEQIEYAAHRLNTALTAMFFDRNQKSGQLESSTRATQSALMNDVRRNLEQAMLRKAELEELLERYHGTGTSNEWDHPADVV